MRVFSFSPDLCGRVAGALGCILAVVGMFALGVVAVPVATLLSLTGLVLGLARMNAAAIGISMLGLLLTIAGFAFTPELSSLYAASVLQ
jgi:hypothetical protein